MLKTKTIVIFLIVAALLLPACSSASVKNAGKELEDTISNITDADNKYVQMVKGGYQESNPDVTYGDAFEEFFASPRWKYFESEDGQDIVEFTGDCLYAGAEVKARLQFVVDEENGTFEAAALAFNEVPQNTLTMYSLILTVLEGDESETQETPDEPESGSASIPSPGEIVYDNDGTPWIVSENGEFCFVNGLVCTDPTDENGNFIDGWFSVDRYTEDGFYDDPYDLGDPDLYGANAKADSYYEWDDPTIVTDVDGNQWIVVSSDWDYYMTPDGYVISDPTDDEGNLMDGLLTVCAWN